MCRRRNSSKESETNDGGMRDCGSFATQSTRVEPSAEYDVMLLGEHFNRDFSRFSEEWLRAAVVGFGAVTVSVCVTKLCMWRVPDFHIRYRTFFFIGNP